MSHQLEFSVSRFKNRNDITSWRVAGWLHGVRIRKNFKSKEEAAAEKAALEIKALQVSAGFRVEATCLTQQQLREAETAFRRLEAQPRSLLFYLDYAILNFREPEKSIALDKALGEYIAAKGKEHTRTLLSDRQFRSIKYELETFKQRFPSSSVAQLSSADLVPFLERDSSSLKTYNNRRGVLSTFFKFALNKEWITANPIEKTPHHRIHHRRGSAITIGVEQAAKLMAYIEHFKGGRLVPYFALCLFGGVRPCILSGEIRRLRPEHVRLDTGVIQIEPEVSKVRMKRLITIQPNLFAWLRAYPLDRYEIVPVNAAKMRRKIFSSFGLTPDVLRHTFISMFVAKFRSMGEAALQAGNSESIIKKHYLDLKSPAEAELFFSILPKGKNDTLSFEPRSQQAHPPEISLAV